MKTPIADFIKNYADKTPVRLHMPGHKGKSVLGVEQFDITEISGADVLYSADGIINESENNASQLFGTAHTYYSTEGSTLAIKTMLYLATVSSGEDKPIVYAARNVHKAFINSAAILDFDVEWLGFDAPSGLISCHVSPKTLQNKLANAKKLPCAVYITSPDYLGNIADIKGLAQVCKQYGVPLLVDNAHGAYLKFINPDMHPITLGATACADSAHKTLPVLTGGAYLHISNDAPDYFNSNAREGFSLFASTSPSYLTLASLDKANEFLSENSNAYITATEKVLSLKRKLINNGLPIEKTEPLKIVINCNKIGYYGNEVADILRLNNIEVEFSDNKHVVMMVTPNNDDEDFNQLLNALIGIEFKKEIVNIEPTLPFTEKQTGIRKAMLSAKEKVLVEGAVGRICASSTVSCPPAIPIAVCGDVITKETVDAFNYYGINEIYVVK